jgi:endonuclease III
MKQLHKIIDDLEELYGAPRPPKVTSPYELILYEAAAYLVSDEKRDATYDALADRIGLGPVQILEAPLDVILQVLKPGGMQPEGRLEKLRKTALLYMQEFRGDFTSTLQLPLPKAKKAFMKFPSIGEPSAEKILLFSRTYPLLALDSNGLRVLRRIGYGKDEKNYSTCYRSIREDVKDEVRDDYDWLIKAHQLLRKHGQQLCKRSEPFCKSCPLVKNCVAYKTNTLSTLF